MPQILKVDHSNTDSWERTITKTQSILKGGGVIAFPTDTFYGLGVDPYNKDAVDKIYKIKNREQEKPLLLLIDSIAKLESLAEKPSAACAKLINSFWPGPLTLLFKPKSAINKNITSDLIAIRQPGNSITRMLLATLDHPLTAPSANLSGTSPATTAQQVKEKLGNQVDLILDAGTLPGGKPSTLIDATKVPIQLVREGAISFKEIKESLDGMLQTQESL